jgi:hypothetical protein
MDTNFTEFKCCNYLWCLRPNLSQSLLSPAPVRRRISAGIRSPCASSTYSHREHLRVILRGIFHLLPRLLVLLRSPTATTITWSIFSRAICWLSS